MKSYKRKGYLSLVSLAAGAVLLAAGLYDYSTGGITTGVLILLFSGFCFYNCYYYLKPYILLDDRKLIINYDLSRKEYLLSNLRIVDSSMKGVEFVETKGGSKKTVQLSFAAMSNEVRKELLEDIHSRVKSL
ncbi:MAG TPA: hypothetical protein PK728_04280 [Bacillota bacterium]|nr:hypothetical protein [Bacillota bacterium]